MKRCEWVVTKYHAPTPSNFGHPPPGVLVEILVLAAISY